MSDPRVTVLLCVYNGELFLREAIDSILAQTWRDFELLVVDDASTDGTPAVLRSFTDPRLRVLRNERNLGLTRSLNVGLRAARGELIARHDADDLSRPERLARQVAFLDAHPDVAMVGSQFVSIDERGHRRWWPHLWMRCETWTAIRWQIMFENPFVHSSVVFRRDAVLALGGYDESFRTNQDFELWSRMARHYTLRNLPDVLVALRARRTSISARYSVEAIRKVGDVLIANADWILDVDLSREPAIDHLLQVTNPRNYPPVESLAVIARWMEDLYRRYVARWPEARRLREIDAHRAAVMARLATLSAAGSPLKMIWWYVRAARHLPTFVLGLPRFVAVVALALLRRRTVVSATATSHHPDQEAK